jgi:hypothetical protein
MVLNRRSLQRTDPCFSRLYILSRLAEVNKYIYLICSVGLIDQLV